MRQVAVGWDGGGRGRRGRGEGGRGEERWEGRGELGRGEMKRGKSKGEIERARGSWILIGSRGEGREEVRGEGN